MTDDELRALAKRAGITKDEMVEDPNHGLMITLGAVRKLAAMAPDTARKMELLALLQEKFGGGGSNG